VSGVIEIITINYQIWTSSMMVPFVIAIVAVDEQEDLRLMTNIIDLALGAAAIELRVKVVCKACDDGIYLPLFEPLFQTAGDE